MKVRRMRAAGAGTVLVLAAGLLAAGPAQARDRIKPKVVYKGIATFYAAKKGDGACMFGPADNMMVAAMNQPDYETARACGAFVRVRASNGRAITVKITNLCPECKSGHLDLSAQAFAKLTDPKKGQIKISWWLLSPRTSRKIAIRYKSGSSRWWCAIQVIDHRNPVASLQVRTTGGWRRLPRTEYNYFLAKDGKGCRGAVRVTDIYGQTLSLKPLKIRPNVVQRTRVQFARH